MIETQLRNKAKQLRPDARVSFDNNGQTLNMIWEWRYRGHDLKFNRIETLRDYKEIQQHVDFVIDLSLNQMRILEEGIDSATPNNT